MSRWLRALLLLAGVVTGMSAATVVCLGDSLTAGYGLPEAQAYPALVQELARRDGLAWTVVNHGLSGDTTAGALRRVDRALKAKPDLVLIAVGGNDGLRGQPTEAMRANLTAIIQRLRTAGVRSSLAGMQVPPNFGTDHRRAFAAVFTDLAAAESVPLLPFLLTGVAGDRVLNQPDGIHPTAAGQQIIAANVYAFLKPLLAR